MSIAGIDVFFIIIIVGMSFIGLATGFIKEFFSKAAVFFGLLFAVLFFKKLSVVLPYPAGIFSQVMAFLIIFLCVYLLVKILQKIIGSIFENETLKSLDRALGFFFGIFEGLVIVGVIVCVISIQNFFDLSDWTNNSIFFYYLQSLLPQIKESLDSANSVAEELVTSVAYAKNAKGFFHV